MLKTPKHPRTTSRAAGRRSPPAKTPPFRAPIRGGTMLHPRTWRTELEHLTDLLPSPGRRELF